LVLLLGALQGCASLSSRPKVPSAADSLLARTALAELVTDYWRDALTRRYDLALAVGVPVSALPDVSQDGRKEDLRLAQRLGSGLDQLNVAALAQPDYLTTLALRWELDARAEAGAFYLGDFSLLAPPTSPIRNLTEVYRLHPLASTADAERYLFFAEAFPFVLERIQSGLEARRARGYVAPREMVESALAFYRGLRSLGERGPWHVDSLRAPALDSADRRALALELSGVTTLRIVPALDSLIRYLDRSYLRAAAPRAGLWQYPGGKELYRHLLRRHSSLDVPPDEAHRVGLGELRRIDSTMTAFRLRQRWNADARVFHDSLRRTLGAAPSLAVVIDSILRHTLTIAPRLVGTLATLPVYAPTVRAATPAEAVLWPDGTYLPATTADTLGTLLLTPRWQQPAVGVMLASLSYRYVLPGLHTEAALTRGNPGIQALRRYMSTPGFSEGWGHYAAALAGELGMYADPLDAYGRLLDEGSAMALLVVDTGIHYLGWSMAQGRAVLGRYVLATDATIDSMLVERVINTPGLAGAGALGAREVAAMRAWMQRELGARYQASAWHTEMLSLGSLPLPIVGSHLEWWLYDVNRQAAEAARKAAAEKAAAAKAAAAKADSAKRARDSTATRRKPGPA
jgi:uncharacterized protein (DUF885 family)